MSKIRIVTDSSITIEPELVEKYNITIVPLSVMVDGVIYSDSDLYEEGRFLEMMKNSKELPKTSQPPVGLFAETFEKLIKDGAEQIIAIHLMHTLSGTCEASRQGSYPFQELNVTVYRLQVLIRSSALKIPKLA
ncbi:DegV family protein [Streptococcus thermophilus CNCM I-1630]|nr:DegV family protein [Streptococcus thermophilus CNCM I-1630]